MPEDPGVEARMGIGPVDHMAVGSTRLRRYRRSIRSRVSGMRDFLVVRNKHHTRTYGIMTLHCVDLGALKDLAWTKAFVCMGVILDIA